MNLLKKKKLAARVMKVGADRIIFNQERLDEIKEAITNQDIKDLIKSKVIIVRDKKGKRKIRRRKNKRGPGKTKKKVRQRKKGYVKLTRKLRKHIKSIKKSGKIDKKEYKKIRTKIRAKTYRSRAHLKEVELG